MVILFFVQTKYKVALLRVKKKNEHKNVLIL